MRNLDFVCNVSTNVCLVICKKERQIKVNQSYCHIELVHKNPDFVFQVVFVLYDLSIAVMPEGEKLWGGQ